MSSSTRRKVKRNTRHLYKLVIPVLLYACFILSSFPLIADEYLDELAAEAKITANVSSSSQLNAEEQEQMQQMELMLIDNLPATYNFYEKLYPNNKERAFKAFAADDSDPRKRQAHLKSVIMELYFDQ